MSTEFCRIADFDLFVVRIKTSNPTIWQRQPQGVYHLLCLVPPPFTDSFATLQEWDWNQKTGRQSVQLDFLSRISMPPSTPFESAAYYDKLRSATIGGFNRSISKEILRYHLIDKLFTVEESLTILRESNFFQQPVETWEQFISHVESTNPPNISGQGTVVLPDLLDITETIPVAQLTPECVIQLHEMRHRRYQQRQQRQQGILGLIYYRNSDLTFK